jgi:hypothetical protein
MKNTNGFGWLSMPCSKSFFAGIFWLVLPALAFLQTAAKADDFTVLAGGVAGVQALAEASNSTAFRAAGGGVYLHNNGWGRLDAAEREKVLKIFSNAPVAVELGFGGSSKSAEAWAKSWRRSYGSFGLQPEFIAANAFASNNHPTPEQWTNYMAALRAAGVPVKTLILPTFEYQNFGPNRATLAQCGVSRQPVFQTIIRAAGGIVLDSPPGFFFAREQAYRDWVVDAIRWTHAQGLRTVVIVSPHKSLDLFAAHSEKFLAYLRAHNAVPNVFAVENYNPGAAAGYPNRVGNENQINTALGVARWLQTAAVAPSH